MKSHLIYFLILSSPRVQTLMRGLSPAYLRFGGSPADWIVFSNEPEEVFEKSAGVAKMLHTYNSEFIYKWRYILVSRIERIPLVRLYGKLLKNYPLKLDILDYHPPKDTQGVCQGHEGVCKCDCDLSRRV